MRNMSSTSANPVWSNRTTTPASVFSSAHTRWLLGGADPHVPGDRRVREAHANHGDSPVAPGTSTVEITLEPDGADGTLLRLAHTGLPLPAVELHRDGWHHYLDRL